MVLPQFLSILAKCNVSHFLTSLSTFNHPFTQIRYVDGPLNFAVSFAFDTSCEFQILQHDVSKRFRLPLFVSEYKNASCVHFSGRFLPCLHAPSKGISECFSNNTSLLTLTVFTCEETVQHSLAYRRIDIT